MFLATATNLPVTGLTVNSVITGNIQFSSNPVEIVSITATATGFDILFNGDPGAVCYVNYIAFIASWAAQGV